METVSNIISLVQVKLLLRMNVIEWEMIVENLIRIGVKDSNITVTSF